MRGHGGKSRKRLRDCKYKNKNMTIEKAKCGGYVAHYKKMSAYGRTMVEALLVMCSAVAPK